MYLACIGILWKRDIFLMVPSGSGDFPARMNAYPLLCRYGSAGTYTNPAFFWCRFRAGLNRSGYDGIRPEYCFHGPV